MFETPRFRFLCRGLLLMTAVVQLWAILIYQDIWHYNNDPINNISSGLNVSVDEPIHQAFKVFAQHNCWKNYSGHKEYCENYQNVLTTNLYLNYPVTGFFGMFLATDWAQRDFLVSSAQLLVASTLARVIVASLLSVVILWHAGFAAQLGYAAITGGALLSMRFFATTGDLNVVSLVAVPDQLTLATTLGLVVLGFVIAILVLSIADKFESNHVLSGPFIVAAAVPVVVLMGLRVLESENASQQAIGVLLAIAMLLLVMRSRRLDWLLTVTVILIFLACINAPNFQLAVRYERGLASIVLLAGLATLASGRKSRAVWLMPLAALFHVSIVGLVGIILLIAESVICVAQRRLSQFWLICITMAVVGIAYNQGISSATLTGFDFSQLPLLISYLAAPEFFYGAFCSAIFSLFAITLLVRRPKEGVWLARACLYLAALSILNGFSSAIAGHDEAYRFRDGWYAFMWFDQYLGPPLQNAALLATLVWLLQSVRVDEGIEEANRSVLAHRYGPVFIVLCAVTAFVTALSPAIGHARLNLVRLGENAYLQLIGKRLPPHWEREFSVISRDKNLLTVSREIPKNHPAMYFSLLKLRVLLARGEEDVDRIRFSFQEDTKDDPEAKR